MNELAFDRRENRDRVVYQTRVRLLTFSPTRDCWVQAQNLSETGMFVTTDEAFTMATELLVDVPLPPAVPGAPVDEPVSLAMRGRVIWLEMEQGEQVGVGIAFLDLSRTDRLSLRRVVDKGRPMDLARCVSISMDGVAGQIQAWATPSPEGLLISQQPPHLRDLSAPVRDTRVQQQIEHTITSWPPLPQADEQDDDDIPLDVEPPISISETLRRGAVEFSRPLALVTRKMDEVEDRVPDMVSQLKEQPEETPYILEGSMDLERSVWEMEPLLESGDALERSVWEMKPLQELEESRDSKTRRGTLTLWLVALLMCAIAAASVVHTGLWDRVSETLSLAGLGLVSEAPEPAASPVRTVGAPRPRVRQLPTPVVKQPEVKHPVVKQPVVKQPVVVPEKAPAKGPVAEAAVAGEGKGLGKGKGIVVTMGAGNPTVVVPIKGSIEGARSYLLSSPHAVAVNLPHAKPGVPFRNYTLTAEGLRMVWVKARNGGLHLRFFFEEEVLPHKLHIEQNQVRLVLK